MRENCDWYGVILQSIAKALNHSVFKGDYFSCPMGVSSAFLWCSVCSRCLETLFAVRLLPVSTLQSTPEGRTIRPSASVIPHSFDGATRTCRGSICSTDEFGVEAFRLPRTTGRVFLRCSQELAVPMESAGARLAPVTEHPVWVVVRAALGEQVRQRPSELPEQLCLPMHLLLHSDRRSQRT